MKTIFTLIVPLFAVAIVLLSSSWCSSTNLSGDQTEISLVFYPEPEYVIDLEENGTIFNISGKVIVETMDPRMYSINLQVDSADFPAVISPTMQYGSGSGDYSFTLTVNVPKQTEDCQYEITVSGKLQYLVGAPLAYRIGPASVIMNIKVLKGDENSEDTGNNTGNNESPGLELSTLGSASGIVIIFAYYYKRKVRH